jgi:hypothetical protein
MKYLTYDEYIEMGGILEPAAFDRYSVRAFSRIAQETRRRIDTMQSVPLEVKYLSRDLIEFMSYNLTQEKTVVSASQSQGGASESESYANKNYYDIDREIDGMIYDYLATVTDDEGTLLLYRGC